MSSSRTLDEFCEFLGQADPDQGDEAARRFRSWCSGQVPYAYPAVLGRHMRRDQLDLVFDAFREVLPFGTGGRRGRVGYGPNRINLTTIAMTVQGHCEHLRAAFPDRETLTVVVANDVRVFNDLAGTYTFLGDDHPLLGLSSRSLARFVCEVYAGNGVRVYFPDPEVEDAVLTTPELSFLIRELGAAGGVNISASHNPPDDNGIKLYDHHGGQPVAPDDQRLIDRMEQVERIRSRPFDESRASGLIREIPENLHQEYVRLYVGQAVILDKPRQDIPITYTPLCGCGMTTVGEVLTELGFPLLVPPDQRRLDGTFAAIPLRAPNPEVPQATLPAREFAGENGSSIVLSSDPDADRVGVEARLEDGSWYHFDGNQIAAILGYYLMLDPHGPRRRGLVIQTLVTTKILGKIARTAGECLLIDDLLVGFKYVADILKTLEFEGRFREIASSPERLVLAVEESHGVMLVPDIRDKDATPACMIFAALHQRLHGEGRTLLDYYTQILEELGGFDSISRSITMTGAEGIRRKRKIMSSLRRSPPAVLLDRKVTRIVDYLDEEAFGPLVSESDKLPRDVFQIFTDSFIVTVRPSGTEPKLKLYCQLLPGDADPAACGSELLRQTRACTEAASRRVYNELLARIELCLDEAALLLPDIVELDQKQCFEQRTVPELRDSISDGSFRNLEALHDWLRRKTENMTPGGDPLPALKKAVAHLCGLWSRDLGSRPLLDQLKAWAES